MGQDGSRAKVSTQPFFEDHNVTLTREEVHEFIILGVRRPS